MSTLHRRPALERCDNAAESLAKGIRVLLVGDVRTRSWEREDGARGSKTDLKVKAIGPDLTFATAKVDKVRRERPLFVHQGGMTPGHGRGAPSNSTHGVATCGGQHVLRRGVRGDR